MALVLFAWNGAAQTLTQATSGPSEGDTIQRALQTGGLAAVLIVVLWSYRRDLAGLLKEERARTQVLVDLVERTTTASTRLADAVDRCPINGTR